MRDTGSGNVVSPSPPPSSCPRCSTYNVPERRGLPVTRAPFLSAVAWPPKPDASPAPRRPINAPVERRPINRDAHTVTSKNRTPPLYLMNVRRDVICGLTNALQCLLMTQSGRLAVLLTVCKTHSWARCSTVITVRNTRPSAFLRYVLACMHLCVSATNTR